MNEIRKRENSRVVFIRAIIEDVNLSGQKRVHLIANNADGIAFWTDDKSVVNPQEFANEVIKAFATSLIEYFEYCKIHRFLITDTRGKRIATHFIDHIRSTANVVGVTLESNKRRRMNSYE
jgi:hypothetical protein